MRLLYCDESNLEERAGDFLIYGGIIVDSARALELSAEIDALRAKTGVDRMFRLKFNPGPPDMSHQDFLALKQAIIEMACRYGVELSIYVILHDIATGADEARRNGINTVCYNFDCSLSRFKESGLVLIDRFNDQGNQIDGHLAEKFSVGLTGMPYSKELRLRNIVGFHYSAIGQSHFPSVLDIILGSVRFAINAHSRGAKGQMQTAETLLKLVSPMFIRPAAGTPVSELGFTFSPKTVRATAYREKYEGLKEFLAASGVETAQSITSERTF